MKRLSPDSTRVARRTRFTNRSSPSDNAESPRPCRSARPHGWLIALLLLALAPSVSAQEQPADAAADPNTDLWYAMEISGQRVGYAHLTTRREGNRIITTSESRMTIKRGPITLPIEQSTRFVETVDGEPIEAESQVKSSMSSTFQRLKFEDDGPVLTSGQGEQTQTRQLDPFEGDWKTPHQADLFIREQLASGAEQFEIRTVDLTLGPRPQTMTFQRQGEQEAEVFGKVVPAIAIETTFQAMPIQPIQQLFNEQAELVRQTMEMAPGLSTTMLLADEQIATAEIDPPELMARTMIEPSERIDRPRSLQQARYQLTRVDGEELEIPRAGAQQVVYGPGGVALLIVDVDQPLNPRQDTPTDAHRRPSTMVNHEDEQIQQLADQATADLPSDAGHAEIAEALREFTHNYLTEKNLSVGFATASETARTQQGDCTEHAVLLAALLRAKGIPSRTATGLIYIDEFLNRAGVFGYHMWAQAWVDGRWLDYDPVLPDRRFDAAHILLSTSAMDNASYQNDMVQLLPLLSGLEIEVVATTDSAEASQP